MSLLKLSSDSRSIGSLGTCIQVPSLSLAFDMGMAPATALHRSVVLLTHGHMDHISSVGHHIARRELLKLPKPLYIMPTEMEEGFHKLLDAYRLLDKSKLEAQLVLAKAGETFPLGQRHLIRTLPTNHVIPSLGYAIYSLKKKLKPEFRGMPGEKLRDLRESGVEVSEVLETPELVFTGDTTSEVLDLEVVRKARVLITECTFFGESIPVEKARSTYHTHMDEIIARADSLENESIILTHFSARYRKMEIDKALATLPPQLGSRVTTLMGDSP